MRGAGGGNESVYVWPENSCMIRVIKELALSTVGETRGGEEKAVGRGRGFRSTQEHLRRDEI